MAQNAPESGSTDSTGDESAYASLESRLLPIDDKVHWVAVMAMLCGLYKVPDLNNRSGLKKIRDNFEYIHQVLHGEYQRSLQAPAIISNRIQGGLVCIFASMCVDPTLRDKLLDKGILDKVLHLLDIDKTRSIGIRALAHISRHGDVKFRNQIAKRAANIVARLIESFPDDEGVADYGAAILCRCVSYAVDTSKDDPKKPNEPEIVKGLDMRLILCAVVGACQRGFAKSWTILDHTLELLKTAAAQARDIFYENPQLIDFLIGGMRSKDWSIRCDCLSALFRLQDTVKVEDRRAFTPAVFLANLTKLGSIPADLKFAMAQYGENKCDMYTSLKACNTFMDTMVKLRETRDLYNTGLEVARRIPFQENEVGNGFYHNVDPVSGQVIEVNEGFPFGRWVEALPYFSEAIREKGKEEEMEAADIIDLKDAIGSSESGVLRIAKRGIERNPQCAYFHYGMTMRSDYVTGLKAAKKGMKCKDVTPWLEFQMMQRAVEHAAHNGIDVFTPKVQNEEKRYDLGLAHFVSALEDAKRYIDEAPPDNRRKEGVVQWYTILSVLTEDLIKPDPLYLKSALERLITAYRFGELIFGTKPPATRLRLTQELLCKRGSKAMETFKPVFDKMDDMLRVRDPLETLQFDVLAEDPNFWMRDYEAKIPAKAFEDLAPPKIDLDRVSRWMCAYCRYPSITLKKCSGCVKVMYCDADCQKGHWLEHKKTCKPKVAKPASG